VAYYNQVDPEKGRSFLATPFLFSGQNPING